MYSGVGTRINSCVFVYKSWSYQKGSSVWRWESGVTREGGALGSLDYLLR